MTCVNQTRQNQWSLICCYLAHVTLLGAVFVPRFERSFDVHALEAHQHLRANLHTRADNQCVALYLSVSPSVRLPLSLSLSRSVSRSLYLLSLSLTHNPSRISIQTQLRCSRPGGASTPSRKPAHQRVPVFRSRKLSGFSLGFWMHFDAAAFN